MRTKARLLLILTLVLLAVFSSSLISYSESTKTRAGEPSSLFVVISSKNTDLEERSVSAEIQVRLFDLPPDYSVVDCRIENYFYRTERDHTDLIDGGHANLTLLYDAQGGHYGGNVSAVFRLFGLKQFYPFDRYLLNLTFTMPDFVFLTKNSTQVITYDDDYGWGGVDYGVGWDGEMAMVTSRVIFERGAGGSGTATFWGVLITTFLLLGSATLIKPERLEYRLTICLSLFIFSISYANTMKVDGLSFGEALINMLLIGTCLFAIVSIIEKALIELKPKLSVIHYVLDGFALIIPIVALPGSLGWFANRIKVYPWQGESGTVVALLSGGLFAILLLYAYVPKTSVFAVHSLWKNRARIKRARLQDG